jgi:serine/threonine protein kinase
MMTDPTGDRRLQPGEKILDGLYTIERYLNSGRRGRVYLARHRLFNQVAVKRLYKHVAAQSEELRWFERQVRIARALRGEPVLLMFNFGQELASGDWLLVMEYANGGSLRDRLNRSAPLPIEEALELALALCQALAHVHERGYVHGDLKPSGILFHVPVSNQERVLKLGDLGSAFRPAQAGSVPLPSSLRMAHSIPYVAPELLDTIDANRVEASQVTVDQRADIYTLGAILYEMVTGRPPFWESLPESEDPLVRHHQEQEIRQKVSATLPPEPQEARPELLPVINALIIKALAKDPAQRFASVGQMQASLERALRAEKKRTDELSRLRFRARRALQRRHWAQATQEIEEMLRLAPGDADALRMQVQARERRVESPAQVQPQAKALPRPGILPFFKTWKGILALVAVILIALMVPLFTAKDSTALGRWRERLISRATLPSTTRTSAPPTLTLLPSGGEPTSTSAPVTTPGALTPSPTYTLWPTGVPTITPTPTNTPTPTRAGAPRLIRPPNEATFTAWIADVVFEWSAASRPLADDEYYVLVIEHKDGEVYVWTKNSSFDASHDSEEEGGGLPWLSGVGPEIQWRVVVAVPQTADFARTEAPTDLRSEYSETLIFYWRRGAAPSKPTPTPAS